MNSTIAALGAKMLIRSYGMFWERDQVEWSPGSGTPGGFRMLGYRGEKKARRQVVDFRKQTGIYILYDDWGPYYVGLSKRTGVGDRLRAHANSPEHRDNWTRFSWFGFQTVVGKPNAAGLRRLGPALKTTPSQSSIGDLEALLIQVLNAKGNAKNMSFGDGKLWQQVPADENDEYL